MPDGGTPKSASYNRMTVSGIYTYDFSLRDYSDPDDFVPPEGEVKRYYFWWGLHILQLLIRMLLFI